MVSGRYLVLTERDLESLDPLRLDREIARAALGLRKQLRREGAGDLDAADPFLRSRLVAGRSAFRAVRELPESDPMRAPLAAWVYRLADHRINAGARARVEVEWRLVKHVAAEPERVETTLSELLVRALSDEKRREALVRSYFRIGGDVASAVTLLWQRRQEVASRLGLTGPDAITAPCAGMTDVAGAWLERTNAAFEEIRRPSLPGLLAVALAEGATEGWPRNLVPRTVLEPFRATDLFRSVDLDPGELPALVGPTSFLRAYARVGAAWVDAMAPKDQPFVVAHDPFGLRRRTFGSLLALLGGTRAFGRHALGLSGPRLSEHLRQLSAALLVASRLAALRVLLRGAALGGRELFQETFERETHRALGIALSPRSAGSLIRLHEDDDQRFAGALLAGGDAARLRDERDEDWFRDPRTTERLRDEARLSPERTTTKDALERGSAALYQALTDAL
ncbi:MAG TPA: hypothetical protein VHE30_02615 [Polyangiaceae bacterium]|nr:hypothetical protein [Polyangiaceae bacterium]